MSRYSGHTKLTIALNPGDATIVDYFQTAYHFQSGDTTYLVFFSSSIRDDSSVDILSSLKMVLPGAYQHQPFSLYSVTDGIMKLSSRDETWKVVQHSSIDDDKVVAEGVASISKNENVLTMIETKGVGSDQHFVCHKIKWPQDGHSLILDPSERSMVLPYKNAIVACFYGLPDEPPPSNPIQLNFQIPRALNAKLGFQIDFSFSKKTAHSEHEIVPSITKVFTITNESDISFTDTNEIVILDNTVSQFSSSPSLPYGYTPHLTRSASRETSSMAMAPSSSSSSYESASDEYMPPTRPVYEHFISPVAAGNISPFLIEKRGSLVLKSHPTSFGSSYFALEMDPLSIKPARDVFSTPMIWMRNEDVVESIPTTSPVSVRVNPPVIILPNGKKEIPLENTIHSNFVWNRDVDQSTRDSWVRVPLSDISRSARMLSFVVHNEELSKDTGITTITYQVRSFFKFPVLVCIPYNPNIEGINSQFKSPPASEIPWLSQSRTKYVCFVVPYEQNGSPLTFQARIKYVN